MNKDILHKYRINKELKPYKLLKRVIFEMWQRNCFCILQKYMITQLIRIDIKTSYKDDQLQKQKNRTLFRLIFMEFFFNEYLPDKLFFKESVVSKK